MLIYKIFLLYHGKILKYQQSVIIFILVSILLLLREVKLEYKNRKRNTRTESRR